MANKGYTTEAIIESYLGETFNATSVPTSNIVTTMVGWAERLVDDYTDASFVPVTISSTIIDSDGFNKFFLEHKPVRAVASFWVDNESLGGTSTDWELRTEGRTNSNDFVLDKGAGMLYFHTDVPRAGTKMVKVTYTHGYASVPADVQKLTTLLVSREIIRGRLADNLYSSQDSIQVGPITITKAGSQGTSSVAQLDMEIAEAWKAVGRFKSRLW